MRLRYYLHTHEESPPSNEAYCHYLKITKTIIRPWHKWKQKIDFKFDTQVVHDLHSQHGHGHVTIIYSRVYFTVAIFLTFFPVNQFIWLNIREVDTVKCLYPLHSGNEFPFNSFIYISEYYVFL